MASPRHPPHHHYLYVNKRALIEKMKCPFCELPYIQPFETVCCGKLFWYCSLTPYFLIFYVVLNSKFCISKDQRIKVGQRCQFCESTDCQLRQMNQQSFMLKVVGTVPVYCNLKPHGCHWQGPQNDVEAHMLACPHHPCSHRGSGCVWLGVALDVKEHEDKRCKFSPVECSIPGCDAVIPRLELEAHTRACKVGPQLDKAAAAREHLEAKTRQLCAEKEAEILALAEQDQAALELMLRDHIIVTVG
jgi:hypothetical protein